MSDATTIIAELEDLTARLDTASREIYVLQTELAPLEEQWDDLFNDLLTGLLDEYESGIDAPEGLRKEIGSGRVRRLPGEDVRNAIVRKRMREQEPLLYGQHRRKTKELDRMERRAKRIQAQVSSKQSSLSYLKTEAMAAG